MSVSDAARPKRRILRWAAVGVLLFVISVIGWCCWPRGEVDRRLVGKWSMNLATNPYEIIDLRPDGCAVATGRYHKVPDSFRWSVQNGRLIFGHRKLWPNNRFTEKLDVAVNWIAQSNFFMADDEWEIRSIKDDSFTACPLGWRSNASFFYRLSD